jgi:hypothetical protein
MENNKSLRSFFLKFLTLIRLILIKIFKQNILEKAIQTVEMIEVASTETIIIPEIIV